MRRNVSVGGRARGLGTKSEIKNQPRPLRKALAYDSAQIDALDAASESCRKRAGDPAVKPTVSRQQGEPTIWYFP